MHVVQVAEGEQRLDAFLARLADPDQNAGRERHRELPGEADRLQARVRVLVG